MTRTGNVVVWTPSAGSSSAAAATAPPAAAAAAQQPPAAPPADAGTRWIGTPLGCSSPPSSGLPDLAALRWLRPPNGWRWKEENEEGSGETEIMVVGRGFGPRSDDAQGLEHWAAAGATALAAVSASGGGRVAVWWASPDGVWACSQATAPCCCCSSGGGGGGGGGEGEERGEGAKTPSPSSKGGGAAAPASSSPSFPPPLIAADVAASADGSLRVLTLPSCASWAPSGVASASVVAVFGDPTAVSDSGRALSPWSLPRRVGGAGGGRGVGGGSSSKKEEKEKKSGSLLAPAAGSRAASSIPLSAVFVPGTGGASVLLVGIGNDDTLHVVRLDCSFEPRPKKEKTEQENGAEDEEDENPGFIAPPRLEDAMWTPVATWEIPPAAAASSDSPEGGRSQQRRRGRRRPAALLSVSPEGATALVRSSGGGVFALDLDSFSSAPRPLPSAPSITVGAAFSPTGECAAAVGSSGSVLVLPAVGVASTASATAQPNKSQLQQQQEGLDSSSSPSSSLGRAAARRLCWALTNNLSPLGPALLLSAARPEARRVALSLLRRAVALHPWATRPAVAPSASRAAAAVCRLARSRCAFAALADSPEASLEADLLTELRVGDLDVAVRAALVGNSSSSSSSSSTAGAGAGGGGGCENNNSSGNTSSRPFRSLAASDALALAPAVAWAEAVALWLLLSARYWARGRAESTRLFERGEKEKQEEALFLAASANHTPGVRLLASTVFGSFEAGCSDGAGAPRRGGGGSGGVAARGAFLLLFVVVVAERGGGKQQKRRQRSRRSSSSSLLLARLLGPLGASRIEASRPRGLAGRADGADLAGGEPDRRPRGNGRARPGLRGVAVLGPRLREGVSSSAESRRSA